MEYRFQNHLSIGEYITAKQKTIFSSSSHDHRDYHPHYELYFCREHKPQNVTINGQSLYLDTPSVIISAPFSIHSMFTADGKEAYLDRHVIYFNIEVLKYIYSNLSKSIASDTIAAEFHVSRAKLDRDFRRFVGKSVHNAVIDCRLACACDMLSSTKLSVKKIAALCGFESEYYFYSFFKRGVGKTPLAWRNASSKLN